MVLFSAREQILCLELIEDPLVPGNDHPLLEIHYSVFSQEGLTRIPIFSTY